MIKDTGRCGQDDVSEATGREQQVDPGFNLSCLDIVAWRDDTSFVETAVELNHNFAGAVIIDDLKLANVAMSLHDAQEFYDDLGGRPDEDLALSTALGVDDVVKAVIEDGDADHLGSC